MIKLDEYNFYMEPINEEFVLKVAEGEIGNPVNTHLTQISKGLLSEQVIYFESTDSYAISDIYGVHKAPVGEEEFYTGIIYYTDNDGNEVSQAVDRIFGESKLWVAQV